MATITVPRFDFKNTQSNLNERGSGIQTRQSLRSAISNASDRNSSPNPERRYSRQSSTSNIIEESTHGGYRDNVELTSSTQSAEPEHPPRFHFEVPEDEEGNQAHLSLGRRDSHNAVNDARKSVYTEKRTVKRPLGILDVMALIMNKMIGAGFFTTPGTVLLLTQSKSLSIGLWILGGLYSIISFSIYLEYGLNFRYNGGDLIYLDEVWPTPELMSTSLFSGFFICFGNTAGNSVAFAKHILAASDSQVDKTTNFDKRLINLIAVLVLSLVCLLHYFSSDMGLFLNRVFAYYKIGFLFTVFVAGTAARNNANSGIGDWEGHGHSSFGSLSAMIYILYSYQGWENANYVNGEIKVDKHSLRIGGYLAVTLTTILYVLATTGYYLACSTADITSAGSDLGMARFLALQAFGGHTIGFKVCVALSAFGNLIAVVYTSSKVKQCIARQRIIPFWRFFGHDDLNFGTPAGALVLHWITTFVLILAMPNTTDGYSFIIGIFTYGHLIIGLFVGTGMWKLGRRMRSFDKTWKYQFLREDWSRSLLILLFVGGNGLILGVAAVPRKPGTIARYWWPALLGITLLVSLCYWLSLFSIQNGRWGVRLFGMSARVYHAGDGGIQDPSPEYTKMMLEARRDGSNRRITYDLFGRRWKALAACKDWFVDIFYEYFMM